MSYAEVKNILKTTGVTPVHDKETMTKYVRYASSLARHSTQSVKAGCAAILANQLCYRYNDDQWMSFDDPETIKEKVAYANSVG
jgi:GH18 family chitinase